MLAMMVALAAVLKAFVKIEIIGIGRVTFTYTIYLIAGFMFGPLYGFGIGFLADFLGWLINTGGLIWNPFTAIASALLVAIPGMLRYIKTNDNTKIALSFLICFLVCTIAINSPVNYIVKYPVGDVSFWDYLFIERLPVQIPVILANLVLCLISWEPLRKALYRAEIVNDKGRVAANFYSLQAETEPNTETENKESQ